jgi:hypothetical protein
MVRLITPLLFVFGSLCAIANINPANSLSAHRLKSITIKVESSGLIYMGPDTLRADALGKVLADRLWKTYLSTGKMYDVLYLTFDGTVSPTIKDAVINAIKQAQQKTLTDLSLETHKKEYANLEPKQKDKIRKDFPVLFQSFHG